MVTKNVAINARCTTNQKLAKLVPLLAYNTKPVVDTRNNSNTKAYSPALRFSEPKVRIACRFNLINAAVPKDNRTPPTTDNDDIGKDRTHAGCYYRGVCHTGFDKTRHDLVFFGIAEYVIAERFANGRS